MKGDIIGYSLNVMSYHLLPPVEHHQHTDLFSFHNQNAIDFLEFDWPIKSQIQIASFASRIFEM